MTGPADRLGRLRRDWAEFAHAEQRLWGLRRATRRVLSSPPPAAFASFGAGAVIVPPARVNSPECVAIGPDVVVLEGGWLAVFPQPGLPPPRLTIGARTRIGRSCHLACVGRVAIGDDVLLADHVFIADTHHGYEATGVPISQQAMADPRPVEVGRGAFLGIRAVLLPGVSVGDNAYVGAGAVVDRDVPARTVVAGNPARPVRTWDGVAWREVHGWDDLPGVDPG